MKVNIGLTATYLAVIGALTFVTLTGCKTAGVYDPDKTEKVENILTPFVTEGLQLVFHNNQPIKADLGNYFREFGGIFQRMIETQTFSPTYLVDAANTATAKFQGKLPPAALTAKNGVIALYKVLYTGEADAKLHPDKAPVHVAKVIADGINQALRDQGLEGL
jgi:hypothetical protein